MKNRKAAVRYASSLLTSATEKSLAEKVLHDMQDIAKTISASDDLQVLLQNPVVPGDQKSRIFQSIFSSKIESVSLDFLKLLAIKNRANILADITVAYEELFHTSHNIVKLDIESATYLSEENIARISSLLVPTGAKVEVVQSINPDLIGGFIARVGDKQIDSSVLSSLKQLKTEFQNTY